MFKLPDGLPSLRSSFQEWADYAEYLALKNGKVSLHDVVKRPMLIADEKVVSGIEDTTDKFNNKADEISSEINRRRNLLGTKYPFQTTDLGYSIEHLTGDDHHTLVYQFLLLSTRNNMTKAKVQSGFDGTQLFEEIASEVGKAYFGDKTETDVLGTSKSNVGGFRTKLATIAQKMKEGGSIHPHEGFHPQDDNIDVIFWKGFSDKKPSQLIAFGQCKTGTTWQDRLSELNAEAFCKTWFTMQPVLTPVRMFFCAQYFPIEIWMPRAYEAGLVFDRFRIIDYMPPQLNAELIERIRPWVDTLIAVSP